MATDIITLPALEPDQQRMLDWLLSYWAILVPGAPNQRDLFVLEMMARISVGSKVILSP